ncbi:MAG: ROK family protein [Acutalibacteraceae bacterium]|nr:ROK family protein [Acutalibacteraceae bacterium]
MYKVGVDLGGTNIAVGVINDKYEIIGRGKAKTAMPRPAKEIFDDIVKCVKMAVADAGIDLSEVECIGIGTPGSVDKQNGVIMYANNLDFYNVPAVEMINEQLPGIKVYLENDANCAALGEALAGSGKGKNSFVAVTLGTGVGGGVVLDGKLLTGCNDAGGEIGHIAIKFDGEQCNCGRVGCWERYASATALVNQTKAAMLEHKDSVMWELCDGKIENAGGRTAFDGMRAGDKYAKEVCDNYIYYVAVGAANVVNIFQPDMLCFGGGICNEGDTLLKPLEKHVAQMRYSKNHEIQTQICVATLGNDAGIIGAALVQY